MNRVVLAVLGALLLVSCRRGDPACRVRVQRLRERIAAIDWSTVWTYDQVPIEQIPIGEGRAVTADIGWRDPVIIWGTSVTARGTSLKYDLEARAEDAALHKRLYDRVGMIRSPSATPPVPLYLIPTKDARIGLVRRIAAVIKMLGELRLGVRPAHVEQPWRPRKDRQAFYDQKTRRPPPEKERKWNDELIRSVLVPAEGCTEALEVATYPTMSPGDRLERLPDAFEKCGCEGDMETMAALYWFQAFEWQIPLRWHPWDDALVESLGDDATYADLARLLTERYLASRTSKE